MDGAHHGKNGWRWCHRDRDRNGWNSSWQKWVELIVAKMGGGTFIEIVTKMGGTHRGKNGWNSLWQKWVELTTAKMVGGGVIETVTKIGGAHWGKKGWSSS